MKLGSRLGGALCVGVLLLFGNCSPKEREYGSNGGTAGSGGNANDAGNDSGDAGDPASVGGTTGGGVGGGGGSPAMPVAGEAGSAEGGSPTQVCVPDEPACDGNKATSCNAEGTGYLPGGLKCSSKQTCLAGACEELECTPSARFCSGSAVRQCADDGLSSQEAEACKTDEYCDAASATCKTGVCAPNAPACDGSRATVCDASGSGFVAGGTVCGAQTTCEAGECLPWVCPKPGESYCQAQSVKSCSANGLSSEVVDTCVDQTCVAAAGVASCKGVCASTQKKCSGNGLQPCGPDGTYGTAVTCGPSKTCLGTAGKASCGGECGPAQKRCLNNGVQTCDASGAYGAAVSCNSSTLFCSAGACQSAPSCNGLPVNCGSGANDNCCTSLVVAGGDFNRNNDSSAPATVSTFRLDKYEVTVGRFRKFVDAVVAGWLPAAGSGKHTHLNGGAGLRNSLGTGNETGWDSAGNTTLPNVKATWDGTSGLACFAPYHSWTATSGANETRPITCVNWYQAQAFCLWDGGFLPSDAEASYAASGGNAQRTYPWGEAVPGANASLAIYGCYYNGTGMCSGVTNIAPVGSVPAGDGIFKQSDLSGNVWEFVFDWSGQNIIQPCTDCAQTSVGDYRTMRGGSFTYGAEYLTSDIFAAFNGVRDVGVGLRCARAP